MIRVGTSHSKNRLAEKAAETATLAALSKAGVSRADHVIFFASSEFHPQYATILKKIRETSGTNSVVGASANGIITQDAEVERNPAIGVMVIQSEEIEGLGFLATNLQESSSKAGEKIGHMLRAQSLEANLMFLFPDPFSFQSHLFFDGFENSYGYIPMIGGAATDDGKQEKSYQILGDKVTYDSISGLALGGNFRTEIGITRSCQPFGEPFKITRAEGNMIYEMDGRPAYDILLESLSKMEFQNTDQILQNVFLGIPMRSYQTDFLGANYLIRNIMGVNAKKGMLACISPVEEGEFVTFTVRDPALARLDMCSMLEDMKTRLSPSQPAAGFYFNCSARGHHLYGEPNQDIQMIKHYFPNMPILGFFSYGEIAPVDHVNHFHHHSGVFAVIAEKD